MTARYRFHQQVITMTQPVLRVGVVGVGHLGSRHAEIYAAMAGVRLEAVCDIDAARARAVAKQLGCRALTDACRLPGLVDAASLAVPTSLHARLGLPLLREGIHLLVEKPITASLAEADTLIRAAKRAGRILQVGHVERFNAAIHAASRHLTHPRFIEVHRLSPYPVRPSTGSGRKGVPSAVEARGTDVSVVLDVMIHDLDLLLLLVHGPARRIEAVGVPVLSPSEDIANARVAFAGGCIANITASRISDEPIRRIRVFQEDSYLSIDYKAQTVELARKQGRVIRRVNLPVSQRSPLQDELAAFIRSVRTSRPPVVSGQDGRAALALALRIEAAMRRRSGGRDDKRAQVAEWQSG
jgi:predicted dehydrogenase